MYIKIRDKVTKESSSVVVMSGCQTALVLNRVPVTGARESLLNVIKIK